MKKSVFCLLLALVTVLSACGVSDNTQSESVSDGASIIDSSTLENSSNVEDDSSLDESSSGDSSSTDEGFRSEKIVDEAAWNEATGNSLPNNFSFEGRAWYDDVVADMKLSFETSTKAKISLSRTDRPEYVEGGVLEQNGVVYSYYEWAETPIMDLSNAEWEEGDSCGVTNFSYYAKIPFLCYYYEDFSYDEEAGVYIAEDGNVKVWFLNGKVSKVECGQIGFDGEELIHFGTFIFGETAVEFESYPDIEEKGEKVANEDAWVVAFENVRDNYTATGLQFFDNYLTYATFKFDGKKFELNEKPIENGEYIGDFTQWVTDVNGVSYVCTAEGDKCDPWETHSESWKELTGIYDIAYTIWSRYSFSDYTYLEESGSYYLNKIDSGFDIHLWVTIKDGKVKYMKYETQYDGQNMGLEYVFGETEIKLPTGLSESQN